MAPLPPVSVLALFLLPLAAQIRSIVSFHRFCCYLCVYHRGIIFIIIITIGALIDRCALVVACVPHHHLPACLLAANLLPVSVKFGAHEKQPGKCMVSTRSVSARCCALCVHGWKNALSEIHLLSTHRQIPSIYLMRRQSVGFLKRTRGLSPQHCEDGVVLAEDRRGGSHRLLLAGEDRCIASGVLHVLLAFFFESFAN
uniref:Secreted protein n=1 Tax=Anopheles darlingi TaxID=43151 RepID=A0A2M4DEJ5_ANODA